MSTGTRLRRLENTIKRAALRESAQSAARQVNRSGSLSREDWLDGFEAAGRAGQFDREPDFPVALAFYRESLRRAKAQTAPPFVPPADFRPDMARSPELRLFTWQSQACFSEVHEGWHWLAEMALRYFRGIPPVSEVEFRELAAWFQANVERLAALARPSCLLEIRDGRKDAVINLRIGLDKGPRALHAGEVAEDIRHLRARYGSV